MKYLFFLVSILFCLNATLAQSEVKPKTIHERAVESVDELHSKLNLNESQRAKILKIQEKFFTKLEKTKGNFTSKNQKEQHAAIKKMQDLNISREKSILKLLEPAQQSSFSSMMSQGKEVKKEKFGKEKPKKEAIENQNYK